MSVRLSQSAQQGPNADLLAYGGSPAAFGSPGSFGESEAEGVPWARYVDALKRHALFIVVMAIAGIAIGLFAARRVLPVYDAQSTVWIASGAPSQTGPISPQQLLPTASWEELLRSYSIVEPVVRRLRLNVYSQPADSVFFRGFESLASLRPGAYVLEGAPGGRYRLSTGDGVTIERGNAGDSIGRKVGFGWSPDARLLTPGRSVS